jgi:glucosyl-3-phosphoglycerate synthase
MAFAAAGTRDDHSNDRAKARALHHATYTAERVAAARARRAARVEVCVIAQHDDTATDDAVRALDALREVVAVDRVVVIEACGGPAGRAEQAGDAVRRALSALDGDVACVVDAREPAVAQAALGLLGGLLCEPGVSFAKPFHSRAPGVSAAATGEGDRLDHLLARPALALIYPQLAHVREPLSVGFAASRELFERVSPATGPGAEVAMLIDVWREVGAAGVVEVDVGEPYAREDGDWPALAPAARAILALIAQRARREGRLTDDGAKSPVGPDGAVRARA